MIGRRRALGGKQDLGPFGFQIFTSNQSFTLPAEAKRFSIVCIAGGGGGGGNSQNGFSGQASLVTGTGGVELCHAGGGEGGRDTSNLALDQFGSGGAVVTGQGTPGRDAPLRTSGAFGGGGGGAGHWPSAPTSDGAEGSWGGGGGDGAEPVSFTVTPGGPTNDSSSGSNKGTGGQWGGGGSGGRDCSGGGGGALAYVNGLNRFAHPTLEITVGSRGNSGSGSSSSRSGDPGGDGVVAVVWGADLPNAFPFQLDTTWTMTAGNGLVNSSQGYRGGSSPRGSISNEPIEGLELSRQAGNSNGIGASYGLAFTDTGAELLATLQAYVPLRHTVTDLTDDSVSVFDITGWTDRGSRISADITHVSGVGNSTDGYPYVLNRSYLCTLTSI